MPGSGLFEVVLLGLAALLVLSAGLLGERRDFDAELFGEVHCRLEEVVEATHRGPHVGHVAMEATRKTMNVVVVDVHTRVVVWVSRCHTLDLVALSGLHKP